LTKPESSASGFSRAATRVDLWARFLLGRARGSGVRARVKPMGTAIELEIESRQEIRTVMDSLREVGLMSRMLEHLEPGDVVYDVGANVGVLSLTLAMDPGAESVSIHSFEPESHNFGRLSRNIAINRAGDRVTPHRVALGAGQGHATLYLRGGKGDGRHSILADPEGEVEEAAQVPITTASEFARNSGAVPDLVKVDVEGAEGRVLAGLADLLEQGHPRHLFLELHPTGEGDRMPGGQPVDEWLEDWDYRLSWNEGMRSRRHSHYVRRAPPDPGSWPSTGRTVY